MASSEVERNGQAVGFRTLELTHCLNFDGVLDGDQHTREYLPRLGLIAEP